MATDTSTLPHLRFPKQLKGRARLPGGGTQDPQTPLNRTNRTEHSLRLTRSTASAVAEWKVLQDRRTQQGLPSMSAGVPFVLQVDPNLDLDKLRHAFDFEIVSERPDGFVIVAAPDADASKLAKAIEDFATSVQGSATVASVYEIHPESSLKRIRAISETLHEKWSSLEGVQECIVDVGIECVGIEEIPPPPKPVVRRANEGDARWAKREQRYEASHSAWLTEKVRIYEAWDALKDSRTNDVIRFVERSYGGEILKIQDNATADSTQGSFSIRVRISGKGLKDFVQNYPFVFTVEEPDDVTVLVQHSASDADQAVQVEFESPNASAPSVGVIDSGIQEGHKWLADAIDGGRSICLLPDETSVADEVTSGRHGTRVAGAVLFGEAVPRDGKHRLPFWIRNARVLNRDNRIPQRLAPHLASKVAIVRLLQAPRPTRIFNQSINSTAACRLTHMSVWAAELDGLSYQNDILVVQSVGNLSEQVVLDCVSGDQRTHGGASAIEDAAQCRVANPAQSLQALTVGSVAYCSFEEGNWRSSAGELGERSSFSRNGLGIWDVVKPEVVEYGGDHLVGSDPLRIATPEVGRQCYPELVRSTLHAGPAVDRDAIGTSYSTPKVTHLAAHLQALLPSEPCLLYRALIVQSARWPSWALALLERFRAIKDRDRKQEQRAKRACAAAKKKNQEPPAWATASVDTSEQREVEAQVLSVIRRIGFGLPTLERATRNTDFRTTLITSGVQRLEVGSCDIFQVPIPHSVRAAGNDYDVLVEVTLSYVANPRRTRRTAQRYLSVWLDWISNSREESIASFEARALKDEDEDGDEDKASQPRRGDPFPWVLGRQADHGSIHGVTRSEGTLQKDWAVVKLHQLPETLCVAVRAHKGWSRDPEASAQYALAVSFEVLNQEVSIYEDIRVAVDELIAEIETAEG